MTMEEKYSRMNDDYQRALQHQNQMRPTSLSPYPPGGGMSPGSMPMQHSPYMNHSIQGQMSHSPSISSPGLLQPPPGPQNMSPRPNSTGSMVDMSNSPTPNGYHQRASPCSSPGMMGNKRMSRQSPPMHARPLTGHPGPPRIMVPDNRNNMINSEMPCSPNLPAVSLTTPSITGGTGSGYPSPNPYHTNDYPMNAGDHMSGGGVGGSLQQSYSPQPSPNPHHWAQQGCLTTAMPTATAAVHHMHGSGQMSSTGANHISPPILNTMNHRLPHMNMNIKSEPISPPQDSNNTPSTHNVLRPPSQGHGHLSPGNMSPHLSHSNCSSPSGTGPLMSPLSDLDGPMMKRQRVEGWTT